MKERLSNRKIAERLFLSEGSIKQYINQIYSKLNIDGGYPGEAAADGDLLPDEKLREMRALYGHQREVCG